MTTRQAEVLAAIARKVVESHRIERDRFPRHYTNIRWRVFLAERRKVAR